MSIIEMLELKIQNTIREFAPKAIRRPIANIVKSSYRLAKLSYPDWIHNKFQPRQFRAFSIGLPKSGTTSIGNIFSTSYRSAHEPNDAAVVEMLWAARKSRDGVLALSNYYKNIHDRLYWLEMESAWHRGLFPELTYDIYPDARYILTIRDCYSWANSLLDNTINFFPKDMQYRFSTHSTGLFLKVQTV